MTSSIKEYHPISEIRARAAAIGHFDIALEGEATFNTSHPYLLRDLHQIPLSSNFIKPIVTTLRQSLDYNFINKLLEELLADDRLRLDLYRDPIVCSEIRILFNQERLNRNVLKLLSDKKFFSVESPEYEDLSDKLKSENYYELDLLLLGHEDKLIRDQAKEELLKAIEDDENSDEVLESFTQAITNTFEAKKITKERITALKAILEDEDLRKFYTAQIREGPDNYDSRCLPFITEPSLQNLFKEYFIQYLEENFINNSSKPEDKCFPFYCELVAANLPLFKSQYDIGEFLKSIKPDLLIDLIETPEDDDSIRELTTEWFALASSEDKNIVFPELILQGFLDITRNDLFTKEATAWIKDVFNNDNLLVKMIRSDSFAELIECPSFVNILTANLAENIKSQNYTFAHALVRYPKAFEQALSKEAVKDSFIKCLDLKSKEDKPTVREYLNRKPKSLKIAKTHGIN